MKFNEFLQIKERNNDSAGLGTNLSLGKDNDLRPFVVTDDPRNPAYPSNKNLAPIIRAFRESRKVKVYDSMGKDGKSKAHTLGSKVLYMVGGAVRDHLLGKTPKDIDLVTDATPDEIRMILIDNGFVESGTRQSRGKSFFVKGKDRHDKEFVFGVIVNGQEFDLATFRKDGDKSDGRHPEEMLFGSHQEDASRRDFTMNALYLLLNNPDGPNTSITDFHGGIHDLKNNVVKFIGHHADRLDEDLLRALRYARFAATIGKGKISDEIAKTIHSLIPRIKEVISPERIREEFLKGLDEEGVDPMSLVKIYQKLGLLDVVFPGLNVTVMDRSPFKKDRSLLIASMLKDNDPEQLHGTLKRMTWHPELPRISFLHHILNLSPISSPEDLDQFLSGFLRTGIPHTSLEEWWSYYRPDKKTMISFLEFTRQDRTRVLLTEDFQQTVNPEFSDLIDPLTLRPLPGRQMEVGRRKRILEHNKYIKILQGR